jgi:hypothetical protein
MEYVYVADQYNHRIMRWCKDCRERNMIVGRNGEGQVINQLSRPLSFSFHKENHLYVSDNANHRIEKFNVDLNYNKNKIEK